MRAARCNQYGPPESIVLEDQPEPQPAAGEVVVAIRAASINYPDVLIAANRYQVSVPVPFTPGSEFAGVVVATGSGVDDPKLGDAVRGAWMSGAFAERIAVPAHALTPVPDGMTFTDAASFGVTGRTAYSALRSVAEARAGEWVAVLGAAGGVGSAALDVARHLGCRTLALASTEAKLDACRSWGADATLLSGRPDLKDAIREVTDGGADVVMDPVGGPLAETALRAMRFGGRFVTLGFASGEIPRLPLNLVLLKGVEIRGLDVRTFASNAPEKAARDLEGLAKLVRDGLRPRIGARYPLERVCDALAAVAARQTVGKVVIEMPDEGGATR